jgi:hypothetical protein
VAKKKDKKYRVLMAMSTQIARRMPGLGKMRRYRHRNAIFVAARAGMYRSCSTQVNYLVRSLDLQLSLAFRFADIPLQ